jgi:hypothetical protein
MAKRETVPGVRAAAEAYGKLKAETHIAGYTFERACNSLLWLLTDQRWQQLGNFADVNAFLDTVRLDKFRAVAEERKKIAELIKEQQPKASNRKIAKVLGVDETTVRRDTAANAASGQKKASPIKGEKSAAAANAAPALSGAEVARLAQQRESKLAAAEETVERREASRGATPLPDGAELRVGDCRVVLADVPDNSVPLVLTDPPYGDDAEPLYRWLAQWAARVLIPGGSLVCYTGQSRLDRDMRIMSEHLRWWWLMIMPHDQSQRLPGKFIIAGFKPVLWYVKDHRRGRTLVPDVLQSPARDKELHNWSQGDGGVSAIIEHLTEPGELIIDPFAGAAAWGERAATMGRRWLGADVIAGGDAVVLAGE